MGRTPLLLTPDPDSPQALTSLPLDAWVDKEMARPEHPWLMKNLIMPGGLTLVAGRAKMGKSFWSILMGIAMATGRAWGPLEPVGRSPSLYLDLEGVARMTAERVTLLARGMHFDVKAASLLRMCEQREFQLLQKGGAARLATHIQEHGIQTVFLDTFVRSFTGDENKASDAQKFLDTASEVRASTGCAIVLVHHVNKQSFYGKDTAVMMDPDAGVRGSSAISAGYDVVVNLGDGYVEGEHSRFAISRGKYTGDWWCRYDINGEKDSDKRWTTSQVAFGDVSDELALIERGPDAQSSYRKR